MKKTSFLFFYFVLMWTTIQPLEFIYANPLSLRVPIHNRTINVVGAIPFSTTHGEISLGGWFTEKIGVSTQLTMVFGPEILALSAIGFSSGTRWYLIDPKNGWGINAYIHGGFVLPLLDPNLALTFSPSITGGYFGKHIQISAGIVAPMAIQFFRQFEFALPLSLETWLTYTLKRFLFGLHGNVGVMTVNQQATTGFLQLSIVLSVQL